VQDLLFFALLLVWNVNGVFELLRPLLAEILDNAVQVILRILIRNKLVLKLFVLPPDVLCCAKFLAQIGQQ
jgi:hypothetical protein